MTEKRGGDGFCTNWKAGIPAIPAIPAKAGIQHRKRAPRAPLQEYPMKAGAGRQVLQCARSALYLRGIPAFAGMTWRGRNDKEGGRNDMEEAGMTEKKPE